MTEKEKQERILRIKEQDTISHESEKQLKKIEKEKVLAQKLQAQKDKELAKAKKKYEKQFVLIAHEPAIYIKEITEIDDDGDLVINGINFTISGEGCYDDDYIELDYEECWSEDSLSIISRDKLVKMIEDKKKERINKLDKMIQKINSVQG